MPHETAIVVAGPMKTAKSLMAILQHERWVREGWRTAAWVPSVSVQRDGPHIRSRTGIAIPARVFDDPCEILQATLAEGIEANVIDEVHFADPHASPNMGDVVQELKRMGIRVFASGLLRDFRDRPFETMAQILPHATEIHVLDAICEVCHKPGARYNQRLIDGKPAPADQPVISVEGVNVHETYEVRCRSCFVDVLPSAWSAGQAAD